MAAVWRSVMIFFAAALPFVEGKGAVLLARLMHMPARLSYALSVAGSYTPVPFLIYGGWNMPLPGPEKLPERLRSYAARFGCWALLVLIAVPFTGLGCWLGALAARALKLDKNKSALAIFAGNAIALLLMTGCLSGLFMVLERILHMG